MGPQEPPGYVWDLREQEFDPLVELDVDTDIEIAEADVGERI